MRDTLETWNYSQEEWTHCERVRGSDIVPGMRFLTIILRHSSGSPRRSISIAITARIPAMQDPGTATQDGKRSPFATVSLNEKPHAYKRFKLQGLAQGIPQRPHAFPPRSSTVCLSFRSSPFDKCCSPGTPSQHFSSPRQSVSKDPPTSPPNPRASSDFITIPGL